MKVLKLKLPIVIITIITLLFILAFSSSAAIVSDADGDGKVSASDARTILRVSVSLESFSKEQKAVCDFDENERITALDARYALRTSVKLEEEKHYYTKELVEEATCLKGAKYKRICTECDDVYFQDTQPLGHVFSEPEVLVQVTCEQDGKEKITCTVCDYTEEVIIPGGHIWNISEPTCTEDKVCDRCKEKEPKLGHSTDWGNCTNCNVFVTDKYSEQASGIKTKITNAIDKSNKAYETINSSETYIAYLQIKTKKAKPLYEEAKTYYEEALELCGDIPEFKNIKKTIKSILKNLTAILLQLDVIIEDEFINSDNFYILIEKVDLPQWDNDELNEILTTEIKW